MERTPLDSQNQKEVQRDRCGGLQKKMTRKRRQGKSEKENSKRGKDRKRIYKKTKRTRPLRVLETEEATERKRICPDKGEK